MYLQRLAVLRCHCLATQLQQERQSKVRVYILIRCFERARVFTLVLRMRALLHHACAFLTQFCIKKKQQRLKTVPSPGALLISCEELATSSENTFANSADITQNRKHIGQQEDELHRTNPHSSHPDLQCSKQRLRTSKERQAWLSSIARQLEYILFSLLFRCNLRKQ